MSCGNQDGTNQWQTSITIREDSVHMSDALEFLADAYEHVDSSNAPLVVAWTRDNDQYL